MAITNKWVRISVNAAGPGSHGATMMVGNTKREIMAAAREVARRCIVGDAKYNTAEVSRYGEHWNDVQATRAFRWLVLCTTSADARVAAHAVSDVVRLLGDGTKRA